MRFTPFDKDINDVDPSELGSLKNVHEGWFVEYKSQLPRPRGVAKSLASFANKSGGWLFLGVDEDESTMRAGDFPGISNEDIPLVLETLRNAAKDLIRPVVDYRERIYPGPIKSIGLDADHSLVAVYVPEGTDTPYVHNDGRIYIRIGDSSSPVHTSDKATFDMLTRRGESKRQFLKSLTDKTPIVSEGERLEPYLHLAILSDPYETLGHRFTGAFSEFCEIMGRGFIPFDNFYSAQDGFVARQVAKNDRYLRLLTWEFSRNGHSFVTLPIPKLTHMTSGSINDAIGKDSSALQDSVAEEFRVLVAQNDLGTCTILDLTDTLAHIGAVFRRHRTLMSLAGIGAPLYCKARLENVWRTIPFIDLPEYIEHVSKYDFPLAQIDGIEWPPSSSSSPCFKLPERNDVPEEPEPDVEGGPIRLSLQVMEALGIPGDFVNTNFSKLWETSSRRREK